MDLWVRSQNKKRLVKVDDVVVKDYNGYYYVLGYENEQEVELGKYGFHSSTRALEVLDEIQRIIEPRLKFQEIKTERKLDNKLGDYDLSDAVLHTYQSPVVKELGTYVYEMPEE